MFTLSPTICAVAGVAASSERRARGTADVLLSELAIMCSPRADENCKRCVPARSDNLRIRS
jgi:predicted GNAT family acetyltransferase